MTILGQLIPRAGARNRVNAPMPWLFDNCVPVCRLPSARLPRPRNFSIGQRMQKKQSASTGMQEMLIGVLCAVVAAWVSLHVYDYLFSHYATARFWETWLNRDGTLNFWVPLVAFAFLTGILLGVIIGLIFPQHIAVRIAGVTAVLQFAAGVFSGGAVSGLVTAVGLVMGALPSSISRASKPAETKKARK